MNEDFPVHTWVRVSDEKLNDCQLHVQLEFKGQVYEVIEIWIEDNIQWYMLHDGSCWLGSELVKVG